VLSKPGCCCALRASQHLQLCLIQLHLHKQHGPRGQLANLAARWCSCSCSMHATAAILALRPQP
jgi:hypothetical protein